MDNEPHTIPVMLCEHGWQVVQVKGEWMHCRQNRLSTACDGGNLAYAYLLEVPRSSPSATTLLSRHVN